VVRDPVGVVVDVDAVDDLAVELGLDAGLDEAGEVDDGDDLGVIGVPDVDIGDVGGLLGLGLRRVEVIGGGDDVGEQRERGGGCEPDDHQTRT
jgi:hypothetical protein